MKHSRMILAAALVALGTRDVAVGELTVVSIEPAANSLTAPTNAKIVVTFDQPLDPKTLASGHFWAFGRWSGTVAGQFVLSDNGATVTLNPEHAFSSGEQVMVILSHHLRGIDGSALRSAGYSWQFWTRARPSEMSFQQTDVLSTNAPGGASSRPYGGIASDLNGDGWLDITTVNEDTADLRVFLNNADGTGSFESFLQPTFPAGAIASPSEPGDFNHDGHADICVANQAAGSLSILLGNGDGTFAPQQQIPVGSNPRGVAVLDADGDGDVDIVNTNNGNSNLSILLNNGSGVFGSPAFFEGGASSERGLAAADMNNDGILDLVIGTYNSQLVLVNRGNGDGTFTNVSSQAAGGAVWMLAVGDVNGDGHQDVATANGTSNNCAILLGNGTGDLAAPQTFGADPFLLSTDLGDLDGDGDLDWVTASFSGDWRVFTNNGAGAFSFAGEINAPSAASCALPMDIDNDGDLDLALVDEIADVVLIMKNSGTAIFGDLDGDGDADLNDFIGFSACISGPDDSGPPAKCSNGDFTAADAEGDDDVDLHDVAAFATSFTG